MEIRRQGRSRDGRRVGDRAGHRPGARAPRAHRWWSPTSTKRAVRRRSASSPTRAAPRSSCAATCRKRVQSRRCSRRAVEEFGGIDIVHNNAGMVCGWPLLARHHARAAQPHHLGEPRRPDPRHAPRARPPPGARRRRDRQHRVAGGAVPADGGPGVLRDEGGRRDVHPSVRVARRRRHPRQRGAAGPRRHAVAHQDRRRRRRSRTGPSSSRDVTGVLDPSRIADAVLDLVRDDTAVAEERVVLELPMEGLADAEGGVT